MIRDRIQLDAELTYIGSFGSDEEARVRESEVVVSPSLQAGTELAKLKPLAVLLKAAAKSTARSLLAEVKFFIHDE